MERAATIGKSRSLYGVIKNTGPRKPNVSEEIRKSDNTVIQSKRLRVDRSAEYFREQFR